MNKVGILNRGGLLFFNIIVICMSGLNTVGAREDKNVSTNGEQLSATNSLEQNSSVNTSASKNKGQASKVETEYQDNYNEIVVTGTHIKGVDTSVGNQVVSISNEDIQRSGHYSIREIFQLIPQNFGGGATGEFSRDAASRDNEGQSVTINLRGLGSGATLVLLNGRRLPAGGSHNNAVDVSIIPVSAIERIEILPDGASAIYGADAVAGVVNFILRKDFTGVEARVRHGEAAPGRYNETEASILNGETWNTGNFIFSYDFSNRNRLRATDRRFSSSSDFTDRGGGDNRLIFSNPANIVDPVSLKVIYAVPPHQDGIGLVLNDLLDSNNTNYLDPNKFLDILLKQEKHGIFSSVNQYIIPEIELFIEGRYSHREFIDNEPIDTLLLPVPASSPFYVDINGSGEPIYVAYSLHRDGVSKRAKGIVENYGFTAGGSYEISGDWSVDAWISLAREETQRHYPNRVIISDLYLALNGDSPKTAFNPLGDGSHTDIELISRLFNNNYRQKIKSDLDQLQIIFNGALFEVNENEIMAAFGADIRTEKFSFNQKLNGEVIYEVELKRKVESIFGEVFVPLADNTENTSNLLKKLELSASIRHEVYRDSSFKPIHQRRDKQRSTNPRIGLLWSPADRLNIRGSYGTSFRAPALDLLSAQTGVYTSQLFDPTSPTGYSYVMIVSGSLEDVGNEKANTYSLGIDYKTSDQKTLAKIGFFSINFKDRVVTPTITAALVDSAYGSLIIRNPSAQNISDTCALATPGNTNITPADCTSPGPVQVILDARSRNFSRNLVEGFDFEVSHVLELKRMGQLNFSAVATYLTKYKIAISPDSPIESRKNTPEYPVDFRARLSLGWSNNDNLSMFVFLNYTDDYKDVVRNRRIKSFETVDLSIVKLFRDDDYPKFVRSIQLQFSVTNIFNENPPFYENLGTGIAYDPANADPFGRVISVSLSKRW